MGSVPARYWPGALGRLAAVALVVVLATVMGTAQHGVIDSSFSADGKVTLGFGGNDSARAVVTQPDGRIIVAGRSGAGIDFGVVRYNADGSLDTTFSADGKIVYNFGGDDVATAVALDPSGNIVVVGYTSAGASGANTNNFAILRLDAAGVVSATTVFDYGGDDRARAVAIDGAGRVVVAGATGGDVGVVRYTSNIALDTSFGSFGGTTVDLGTSADVARAVAIDELSRIVVAGSTDSNVAVARLLTTGGLDTTFDGDGKWFRDFSGTDAANALALRADGRLVVAGECGTAPVMACVVALNGNGTADTTFTGSGTLKFQLRPFESESRATGVVLLANGKIAVSGTTLGAGDLDMAVLVLSSAGTPDASFGGVGSLPIDIGSDTWDMAWGMARQYDGNLVVVGQSGASLLASAEWAVVRIGAEAAVDTTFDVDGRQAEDFGGQDPVVGRAVVVNHAGTVTVAGSQDAALSSSGAWRSSSRMARLTRRSRLTASPTRHSEGTAACSRWSDSPTASWSSPA